jgi:hypothetical protein
LDFAAFVADTSGTGFARALRFGFTADEGFIETALLAVAATDCGGRGATALPTPAANHPAAAPMASAVIAIMMFFICIELPYSPFQDFKATETTEMVLVSGGDSATAH